MLRRLSVGLLASALAIAPLPTKAQDGTAEDLGDVMSISLKDVIKPQVGIQGAVQGAGTPSGGCSSWSLKAISTAACTASSIVVAPGIRRVLYRRSPGIFSL